MPELGLKLGLEVEVLKGKDILIRLKCESRSIPENR